MKFRTKALNNPIPTKDSTSIYHYCKLDTALEFILPKMELLLNPIVKTNDPRENQDLSFISTYLNSDEDFLKENSPTVSTQIREGCKVLCFSP